MPRFLRDGVLENSIYVSSADLTIHDMGAIAQVIVDGQ